MLLAPLVALLALSTFGPGAATLVAKSAGVDAPVTINSCGPIINRNATPTTIAGIPVATSSTGIQIQFTNETDKTVDLVNFAVDSNGTQFVIRDVGKFSPGVSIDHQYRNGAGQAFVLPALIAPNIRCRVASVRFEDGSTWRKGTASNGSGQSAPPPPAANSATSISANPARIEIDRATDSELFMVSSSQRVTAFKESDDCTNVASVFVAATGQSSATYTVRPLSAGSCTARIVDEAGNGLSVPILVR